MADEPWPAAIDYSVVALVPFPFYIHPVHIKADKLVKKYGWAVALEDLSWEVEPGQIVAVLGPNGAGKSTLLNALSGSIRLDSGRVLLDGRHFTPDCVDLRQRIAFLPDIPPVPQNWSPVRFIGSLLKLYGKTDPALDNRVMDLFEELDLLGVATWKFRQLSRGQQWKAVLAGFVAADPEVWLVDEPFSSGMDPRGLNCFKEYARSAAARGHTIIFTTQIIEVAAQLADTICVLDHGRIKSSASPDELRSDSAMNDFLNQLRENPRS